MSEGIQPTASSVNTRLRTTGAGGSRCASGRRRIVTLHHAISRTTISVVTDMIFSALARVVPDKVIADCGSPLWNVYFGGQAEALIEGFERYGMLRHL